VIKRQNDQARKLVIEEPMQVATMKMKKEKDEDESIKVDYSQGEGVRRSESRQCVESHHSYLRLV
jgi:hypothetical protein